MTLRIGKSRERVRVRGTSAFTLIEVLVTLVILSTGIVVVLHAFESSVTALGEARDVLNGTALARQKRVEIASELAAGGSMPTGASGVFEAPFEDYAWYVDSTVVASVPSGPAEDDEDAEDIENAPALHRLRIEVRREGVEEGGVRVETYVME